MRNTRGWAIGIAALAVMVLGFVVSQCMWGDAWTSGGWNVHGHRMGAHGGWTGSRWMDRRIAGGMGMMGGWRAEPSVRYHQAAAEELAAEFLSSYLPDATVLHSHAFASYYTIDFGRDAIEAMLSVHAASGEVWVHGWHGSYLGGHDD